MFRLPHLVWCATVLAMILSGCGESADTKKSKHWQRGTAYAEKGQYREAFIEFKNVLQIDPNDAEAHYQLGLIHVNMGTSADLQAALNEFLRATELAPDLHGAQVKLAELYLLAGETSLARQRVDLVLAANPMDPVALTVRGRSFLQEQKYTEAIHELQRAIEIDPQNEQTVLSLAQAHLLAKDAEKAARVLRRALQGAPTSAELHRALADLYLRTNKPDQAEVEYKHAIDADPDNHTLYVKLAALYERTHKLEKAEATLQNLAQRKPADPMPYLLLGDFYKGINQGGKVLEHYQRAREIAPHSILARNKLTDHYLDAGNLEEAESLVSTILDGNRQDLLGRYFDARLRLAQGTPDEAIRILQAVVKDEPNFAEAHQYLGIAYAANDEGGQARRELHEAVRLAPRLADARLALARLELANGRTDLAIEQAQAALGLNPRSVSAAMILGDAYFQKGDLDKSKKVFRALVTLNPKHGPSLYRLGLIARAAGRKDEAIAFFERALSANPHAIEPLAHIAMIQTQNGQISQARERVSRQLEASPNNPLYYNLLGNLWLTDGHIQQAENAFKQAIAMNEVLPMSYVNLANLYLRTGQVDSAIQEYETALAKNPKLIAAHMVLGVLMEQRQEYRKAQEHYEQILTVRPRFAPAANNLAWILSEHGGNIDVALSYAQIAREQRPDDPSIADTLGWIYYKKHAFIKAHALLKEAADKLSNNPAVLYHYGLAQYKTGNVGGAKQSLQAALSLSTHFPGSSEAKRVLGEL